MKKKTKSGMKVTTAVTAGDLSQINHNLPALRVRSRLKGGLLIAAENHNSRFLRA